MSPVSRSRKPKRVVHHPARTAPPSPFAPILEDAEQLVAQADPLAAELWASDLLGSLFDAAWGVAAEAGPESGEDPDELFELELSALVEYLAGQRRPGALAALRALGAVGEEWTRELALDAAEPLADRGVKEPAWLANAHEPTVSGLFAAADEFGDREAISLAFTRGDETHVLTALLMQGVDRELITLTVHLGFDVEELKADFADTHAMNPIDLDPAEARIRLEDALEVLLCSEPADLFDEDDEEAAYSDPKALWPLLAVRLELLPSDEDEDGRDATEGVDLADDADAYPTAADIAQKVRAAVAEFLASPRADGLPDREFAGHLVTVLADEAVLGERGVYGYGPLALALSLDGETVGHLALTEQQLDQFEPVLEAWAHFTADARGLSAAAHEAWDVQVPLLADQFREAYLDPEAVAHRADCPDMISIEKYEPGQGLDEQALAEDLARLLAEATKSGQADGEGTDED